MHSIAVEKNMYIDQGEAFCLPSKRILTLAKTAQP